VIPSNRDRAAKALDALDPKDTWGAPVLANRIVDMLANLMHLVEQAFHEDDEFCEDFEGLVQTAKIHYDAECRGDFS